MLRSRRLNLWNASKVALVLCVACGAYMLLRGRSDAGPTKPTTPPAKALPVVTVATPVRMPIVEWDEYVGRLAPIESVEVRARVSGYLAATHFQEGQMVQAGDLLAVIDQRPFLAEVARSEATLVAAKAQLEQAKAAAGEAEAEVKHAEIDRDLEKRRQGRAERLRQRTAIPEEDADIRDAEFEQAESKLKIALAKTESAKAAVIAAQAAVDVAEANLEVARLNLQYTEVRAPITGKISNRYVTEGNLIVGGTTNSTLLTTIVSVDPIHCYFDADENSYLKYTSVASEGMLSSAPNARSPVFIALANEKDGFPHQGHMDFVENRLDNETGTMRGRAIFENKDGKLTPGLFARVRIPGSPKYEAILIPDRAVGTDQAEKFVLVVDEEKRVQRKSVTLGPISHGLRVIRSGLTGTEQVVLSGQQRARVGMEVQVTVDTIRAGEETLPTDFEPIPEEKWLTPKRSVAGNVELPAAQSPVEHTVDSLNAGPVGEMP